MSPSSESLGAQIRRLRMARGLSLAVLARQAGVSKSAVAMWENGSRAPSGPGLAAALDHLGADAGTRASLLLDADPRHAQLELARSRLGPPVGTGEVLRMMRRRAGLRQGDLAAALGVVQSTVARWESETTLPEGELLDRLLLALSATPEEAALVRSPAPGAPQGDPRLRFDAAYELPFTLREAAFALIERDLWHAAARDERWEPLLIEAMGYRAYWLSELDRDAEADALARRTVRFAGRERLGSAARAALVVRHRGNPMGVAECVATSAARTEDLAMQWLLGLRRGGLLMEGWQREEAERANHGTAEVAARGGFRVRLGLHSDPIQSFAPRFPEMLAALHEGDDERAFEAMDWMWRQALPGRVEAELPLLQTCLDLYLMMGVLPPPVLLRNIDQYRPYADAMPKYRRILGQIDRAYGRFLRR